MTKFLSEKRKEKFKSDLDEDDEAGFTGPSDAGDAPKDFEGFGGDSMSFFSVSVPPILSPHMRLMRMVFISCVIRSL